MNKQYFSAIGRIGRRVFWLHYTLPLLVLVWIFCAVDIFVLGGTGILIFLGYAVAVMGVLQTDMSDSIQVVESP